MSTRDNHRTHGEASLISKRIDLALVLAVLAIWCILFIQFYYL